MTNDKDSKKLSKVKDDSDISIISDQGPDISVGHVRNDVKHVIDTMGTNIPQPIESPRAETDNESSYAAASYYSSIVHITEMTVPSDGIFEASADSSAYSIVCGDSRIMSTPSTVSAQCPSQRPANEKYFPQPNMTQACQIPKQQAIPQRESRLAAWLGMKTNKRPPCTCSKQCDLYKINIDQPTNDQSPPRRLVFDLMDEMPKAPTKSKGTNTKKKPVLKKSRGIHHHAISNFQGGYPTEKVDIYYFDHGNSEFYRTTDISPAIMTEFLAERTERYTKKFWAQIFGTINIGVAFVISFLLQLLKFIFQSIVRPLIVGFLQVFSDYFMKPCLAVIFNGILQPVMIFLYNWMTSVRDLLHPLAESIGYFVREIAVICKAMRCCHIDSNNKRFARCKKQTATEEGSGLEDK